MIFCKDFHIITLAKELSLLLPKPVAQAAIIQGAISCLWKKCSFLILLIVSSYIEQSFKLSFHQGILILHLLETFLTPKPHPIWHQKHETMDNNTFLRLKLAICRVMVLAAPKQSEIWVEKKLTLQYFAPRSSCGRQCRLSELFEPQCC